MTFGLATVVIGTLVLFGAIAMIYGLNYPFEMSAGRRVLVRTVLTVLGVVSWSTPPRC